MERPASRLFLAAVACALASACGAGMPLYPEKQRLPSGEETAESARTSTESAGDDVVLYASNLSSSRDESSGDREAPDRAPQKSDDEQQAASTVYLEEKTAGGTWRVTGKPGASEAALELFERIADVLRTPPDFEDDEKKTESDPGTDSRSRDNDSSEQTEARDDSRKPKFDPESIQIQSIRVLDDRSFDVRGTAADPEGAAELFRRLGRLPETHEWQIEFVRARESAEGFEFHFTGRYQR